jgi:glyoxylate utilization-related uncharacterized protein
VNSKDIRDLVRFTDQDPRREMLWETKHLWTEVVCLQGNQRIGPIGDPSSDAVCVVLAGVVAAQIGGSRARLGQWESVNVGAGESLTLANASEEPSVVLLVVAPPPT